MLRHVALSGTDVSQELGAFIIRVTRIGEMEITLAATSNRLQKRILIVQILCRQRPF
jgi:hypothetical protein